MDTNMVTSKQKEHTMWWGSSLHSELQNFVFVSSHIKDSEFS